MFVHRTGEHKIDFIALINMTLRHQIRSVNYEFVSE